MTDSPTNARLEEQISWYDKKSNSSQCWYKSLKMLEIVAAASIPLIAVFNGPAWVTAVLGSLILIIEGVQQVNQYQQNWISYRSTCEALKHEKYLYAGNAGPYEDQEKKSALLAERVESLVSREHAKWVSNHNLDHMKKVSSTRP